MKTLVCDLDNTLVECGIYYRQAVEAAAIKIAFAANVDAQQVMRTIDIADGALIKLRGREGFRLQRFADAITASARFYLDLSRNDTRAEEVGREALNHVLTAPYPCLPNVVQTLVAYKQAGWRLIIWTKGEDWFQMEKVRRNGLLALVEPEDVVVLPLKDKLKLEMLLWNRGLKLWHDDVVVVGDSFRDDIQPALDLGIQAVHIVGHVGPPGYESGETHALTIEAFSQLPQVIGVHGAAVGNSANSSAGP